MKIVILGAGNIANHYAKAFHTLNHDITQIYNRTSANAKVLADAVSTQVIDNLEELDRKADLYIIAVSDQHISALASALPSDLKGIVVHTSGATPIDVLDHFEKHGVIYPPQSLNKHVENDLTQIPFAVEGSNNAVLNTLLTLSQSISQKSFTCNSKQRLALHVSAVFANNFSNALFEIANTILDDQHLDFEVLKPIILETAQKVQNNRPSEVQTGPAIRNDQNTINKHLEFLSHSNNLTEIYQLLSNFIIKSRHN